MALRLRYNYVLQNQMKIEAGRIDDLIVTIPDIEWEFQCKYSTVYTVDKGLVST